ncbi:MAG: hypothetical protein V4555_17835 [Acidobacteriota bacterium]
MAKSLPYFRWFPADAETDEAYSALTDPELGFFHRCLNKAWLNDGLPSEPDEIARVMKVTRQYLDKVWPRVSKMFSQRNDNPSRLGNRRQEEERSHAIEKGEKNKRPGNTNASRGKRDRNAIDTQHAQAGAESVCVSESEVSSVLEFPKKSQIPSSRFEELWAQWPRKFGRDTAERDFFSLVTVENEAAVFACAGRYLASGEVERGAVRNLGSVASGGTLKPGWLSDCARESWSCEWPRARDPAGNGKRSELLAGLDAIDRMREKESNVVRKV